MNTRNTVVKMTTRKVLKNNDDFTEHEQILTTRKQNKRLQKQSIKTARRNKTISLSL